MPCSSLDITARYTRSTQKKKKKVCQASDPQPKTTITHGIQGLNFSWSKIPSHVFKKERMWDLKIKSSMAKYNSAKYGTVGILWM